LGGGSTKDWGERAGKTKGSLQYHRSKKNYIVSQVTCRNCVLGEGEGVEEKEKQGGVVFTLTKRIPGVQYER